MASADDLSDMSDRRKALHDLIDEVLEEDLPLLRELVDRFERPLEFPLEPAGSGSPENEAAQRRQELIMEAHMIARSTYVERQHTAKTAKRLGIHPARVESGAGGSSIGKGDSVQMTRHWSEGPAHCRLNTFQVGDQEIITFDEAKLSDSRSAITYKLRVLTTKSESETDLDAPL